MSHPFDPAHDAGGASTRPGDHQQPVVAGSSSQPTAATSPPPPQSPGPGVGAGAGAGVRGELLQLVLQTPTVEAYLDELVLLVQRLSPVIAGVGITLRRNHDVLSVAVSNPLAGVMDEVQYKLDQGPCLQALSTGQVVIIDDVGTEQRFGDYTTHAREHKALSSVSIPLWVAGTSVGALNSYSQTAHAFDEAVRAELIALAAQAQVFLELALRVAEQSSVVDQLHSAMQTRSTIDQALGIVMTRQRCTAAEAFTLLRSISQSRNRKIVDVAADLITSTTGNPPEAGRFQT